MAEERRTQPDRRTVVPLPRLNQGRRSTDRTRLSKITCPFCAGERSTVKDSRPNPHQDGIFRRRECADCHRRYTTQETVRPIRNPSTE